MEREREILTQMERARSPFESTLQLIYDLCLPDDESIVGTRGPGGKKRYELYATTAPRAAKRFANFLHAIMLPESAIWGNQRPMDENLFEERDVREWFYDANLKMSRALSASNFYPTSLETILDLAIAGVGALYGQVNPQIADDNGSRFRSVSFHAIPVANFFYLEATADDIDRGISMGEPNRIARVLDMEKFEIERKFGPTEGTKTGQATDKYRIVHLVEPNEAMTGDNDRWRSQYIFLGDCDSVRHISQGKHMEPLSSGVLARMPYFVPRMSQKSGEIWPRGFGMDALQDVLEENILTKHMLNSIGKDADPPTVVGHEAALHLELIAGGVSYMDPDRFDQIRQLTSGADYNAVFARIGDLKQNVKEAFLVDQLQLPQQLDRATAEEIITRREDATNALSSTFSKVEREFPAKIINWLFEEMLELDAFDETPDALADGIETQVMFDSPMANARRRRQLEPARRLVERKIVLAQQTRDPSVLDPINLDALAQMEQELEGIDPRLFRTGDEVQQIRQGRQQAAQREEARQNADILPKVADAAKKAQEAGLPV